MSDKEVLAQALRDYPTWGDAYIAEKRRADGLATALRDALRELAGEDRTSALQILREAVDNEEEREE